MSVYDQLLSNHRAAIAADTARQLGAVQAATTDEELKGIALSRGTRVLDRITGQRGTVAAGSVKHTLLPPAQPAAAGGEKPFFSLPTPGRLTIITVTLDDGSVVDRDPAQLVNVPAMLALPLANFGPAR